MSISQFDRKQPEEISNRPELPLVEAVRLAPSARNRQPWYLACKEGCIDFYCRKGGLIDNTLLKNLHWFDIGIAVCHAVLALQEEGFSPIPVIRPDPPERAGCIYGISLNINPAKSAEIPAKYRTNKRRNFIRRFDLLPL